MKKYLFVVIACIAFLTGCQTPYQPTKTPLELQAIQTKEFDTNKNIAFASVLSVLQDLGYVVNSANLDTGLITAKSPTGQERTFVGLRMQDTKATAFVEQIVSGRTKVRINFVNSVQTSSSYGMRGENEYPIEDAETYQSFFSKIQQSIFVRSNL